MILDNSWLKKAYKKLKSNIYFDKTQLPLRDKIVEFEMYYGDVDEHIERLWSDFCNPQKWKNLENSIMESIYFKAYPKNLKDISEDVITNAVPEKHEIDKLQYFIDMDVNGHIFSVLWLLMVGWRLDKEGYEHSYGNRLRNTLINDNGSPTYSPYLFKPYFEQYESWRDTALLDAQKSLTKKQDVVILSLDFASYFYSLDLNDNAFDLILEYLPVELQNDEFYKRINTFVLKVILKYASLFDEFDGRRILPIGFLPSNVLANWCLSRFDQAITDGWNPVYYGRYVDDILIVDKIEHNSDFYRKIVKQELTKDEILQFFTEKCSRWNGFSPDCGSEEYALLQKTDSADAPESKKESKIKRYRVNSRYYITQDSGTKITLQNEKVSIFYFQSGETDALITCFREAINKNKSEFRFMPEDEMVFQKDDYSEIYTLNNTETPNKLRGVKGVSIDKFNLSKYLGKYLRISGLVNDKLERKFEKSIDKIFNERIAVENYTTWEKAIEIMVINEQFDALKAFISKLVNAISNVITKDNKVTLVKYSLLDVLNSALARSFALNWHKEATDCINDICEMVSDKFPDLNEVFSPNYFEILRIAYVQTRMLDKSVIPVLVDVLIKEWDINYLEGYKVNLTCFPEIIEELLGNNVELPNYIYYPYIVTMYDLAIFYAIKQMLQTYKLNDNKLDMLDCFEEQRNAYARINYGLKIVDDIFDVCPISHHNYVVKINNESKDKLTFAIANTRLFESNFGLLLKNMPNRKYARYHEASSVINAAIKENSDFLVMPESYLPFEWLQTVARTCAKSQMALVSGVEHVKIGNYIFNLTATILPYKEDDFKTALMTLHLKTHYAPDERREIEGYRLIPVEGMHYELYNWSDCWFPVYCCYELASIQDRALFQSYADVVIAVEWNKDTNYYSNIMESLSRDLHCYCVQVNSSNYGDSRITQPSKTAIKDLIRTKGGKNSTVLVDTLDIGKLRNFQYKEYELQKGDNTFKPTPPRFKPDVIGLKMHNQLWDWFVAESKQMERKSNQKYAAINYPY